MFLYIPIVCKVVYFCIMAVYLDFNATTPVDSDVQVEVCLALKNAWGNPSSSYDFGKEAKYVIENSRCFVAEMISARSDEIIFTSGGTESNNMVIQSILYHYQRVVESISDVNINSEPHIITTNVEHDSVRLPLEALSKEGRANVTFVPVSKKTGIVDVNDIISSIRPNTCLITVMLANNETGMIQPVSAIKSYLDTLKNSKCPIYLHSDAAQAIGKIKVDVQELGVDYLTIVGHKFYGPRIGALYCRKSCPLYPMFYGGGQESNYRPGTENTCMIAGLGKASQLVESNLHKYKVHMSSMKNYLEDSLKKAFLDKVIFNFKSGENNLPNTLSVAFNYEGITGKMLLNEASGIYAGTGAACHSGGKPSAVLIASGVSDDIAAKTLRLSVGRETSKNDIDIAVKNLKEALFKLSNKTSC